MGHFENTKFQVKHVVSIFLATFRVIWATFLVSHLVTLFRYVFGCVCVRPVKVKVGFSSKLNFFFLTLSLPASSENDKKIFISDDRDQCDQIGRYLKVLGDKISNKSSPNDWQLFGQI